MAELINRQKVLDLVRDICIDIMDECETYIDVIDGETDRVYKNLNEVNAILKCNKRIRNGIRQLSSEPLENFEQLEWIPCSERLPQVGHPVLWCNERRSVFVSAITVMDDSGWAIGKRHRRLKVVAWMPLPEPYQKGEK